MGIDTYTLSHSDKYSGQIIRIIPSLLYEQILFDSLNRYLKFGKDVLDYDLPVVVEAGAANVSGFYMAMERNNFWGPIHRPHIQKSFELNDWSEREITDNLLDAFNEFFDATGKQRPTNLNGFPEN